MVASKLGIVIFVSPLLLTVTSPAGGRAPLVLPGRIDGVAASQVAVVAVSQHVVRILDTDGHPIRTRWSLVDAHPRTRRRARPDELAPLPGLTADSDWTEPIDPDELDDPDDPRVADETETRTWEFDEQSHANLPAPQSESRWTGALAVAAGKAWIGRTDGLWRFDLEGGPAVRTLTNCGSGISFVAAAAGIKGESVAVACGGALSRSRDGGETFEPIATLEAPPRAITVSDAGTVYLIEGDDSLQVSAPDRSDVERVALGRATDVASCRTGAFALAGSGLYSIIADSDGWRAVRVGTAPRGATRIVCGSDSAGLVAYGDGLWISRDCGQSWQSRPDLPSDPIVSVSLNEAALWVATPSGLWRLPTRATEIEDESETRSEDAAETTSDSHLPPPRPPPSTIGASPRSWRWWGAALPRIDLSVAAARSAARHDLRALVVLTFSFDQPVVAWRHAPGGTDPGRKILAADLPGAGIPEDQKGPSTDPITVEERRALAQALEDQQ